MVAWGTRPKTFLCSVYVAREPVSVGKTGAQESRASSVPNINQAQSPRGEERERWKRERERGGKEPRARGQKTAANLSVPTEAGFPEIRAAARDINLGASRAFGHRLRRSIGADNDQRIETCVAYADADSDNRQLVSERNHAPRRSCTKILWLEGYTELQLGFTTITTPYSKTTISKEVKNARARL